jgi:hypothetical protein
MRVEGIVLFLPIDKKLAESGYAGQEAPLLAKDARNGAPEVFISFVGRSE